jgi:AcrR family transcriptional regulator
MRKANEATRKGADKAVVKSQVSDAALIEKRREQIVAASIELFSKQGYDRTTMLDIARKARISVGLIYQYAQTKEDVLFLSLMSVLDSYKREILPASPDDPPIEALWKALDAYARIIDRRRAAAVLAYRSTKSLSPAQRHTIMQLEIETNDLLAERVQACIAAGLFREIDIELAVYQLVMHAHTWALKYWRLNKITTLDHYLMTGFEFFVRAAASPKGLSVYAAFYHRQVGPSVVRRGR